MYNYYDGYRRRGPFGPFDDLFDFPQAPPFGGEFGPPEGQFGPPAGPPPAFTPQQQPIDGIRAVDPGAISRCLFRFTFIWLVTGQRFWFFPIFVGPRSVAGWRWTGFRWVYFGIDLRLIASFTCF